VKTDDALKSRTPGEGTPNGGATGRHMPSPETGRIPVLKARDIEGRGIRPLFDGQYRVVKSPVLERVIDVELQLDEILRSAEALRDQAEQDAQRLREEARAEGIKQGLEAVTRQIASARAEYARLQEAAREDMLALAFGVARRIVGRAFELDPRVIHEIVSCQLQHVRGRRQVTILVHPDNLPRIEAERASYAQQLEGAAIYFGPDPTIDRTGCVIETETGRIDARLDVQLEILRAAIEGRNG
jgi:flagellar biosynthesis/type III secretory pathway protein FliH